MPALTIWPQIRHCDLDPSITGRSFCIIMLFTVSWLPAPCSGGKSRLDKLYSHMVPQIRYHLPYPVLLNHCMIQSLQGILFRRCATFWTFAYYMCIEMPPGQFQYFSHTQIYTKHKAWQTGIKLQTLNNSLPLFSSGLNWPCVKTMPFNSLQNCTTMRYKASSEHMWLQIEYIYTHAHRLFSG